MDYLEGLAHNVTYWLDQILYGTVLSLIEKAVLLCVKLYLPLINCSPPQNSWNMFTISKKYCCRKMDGNKIFDVSEIFRCYFDLFSMFLFYVKSFYVLSFLCFCFSMFRHRPYQTYFIWCWKYQLFQECLFQHIQINIFGIHLKKVNILYEMFSKVLTKEVVAPIQY